MKNVSEKHWCWQWLQDIDKAYRLMVRAEKEDENWGFAPVAVVQLRALAADAKAYRQAYGNFNASNGSAKAEKEAEDRFHDLGQQASRAAILVEKLESIQRLMSNE